MPSLVDDYCHIFRDGCGVSEVCSHHMNAFFSSDQASDRENREGARVGVMVAQGILCEIFSRGSGRI